MTMLRFNLSKEIKFTLIIWGLLMVVALVALLLLRLNTNRIIEHIYYVNVSRGSKAEVLYAEAEKHALAVLKEAERLNVSSAEKVNVPATSPHVAKSITLFSEAIDLDQKPEFDQARVMHYELLSQVYDAAGQEPEQLVTAAKSFISQKNYADAKAYIDTATSVSEGHPEALLLGAQLNLIEGNTSAALQVLNNLESSETLPAKGHWVRSQVHRGAGEFNLAVADLLRASTMAPKNLTYRYDLAVVLSGVGKRPEAIKVLQEGLDDGGWLDPVYLHIYGDLLTKAGDFDEAVRILKQADELAPYSGDIQWSLAHAYHKAGKERQASSALRRAAEIKPELQGKIFEPG